MARHLTALGHIRECKFSARRKNTGIESVCTASRYNECDVGTFPNQTLPDGSGPLSALHSDASREKYNFELSWLSGQRIS